MERKHSEKQNPNLKCYLNPLPNMSEARTELDVFDSL